MSTGIEYDEVGRPEPPACGTELEMLSGFLEFLRSTIAWKCEGLTDEQLRERGQVSAMTLAGMLAHLAWVEDYWFGRVLNAEPTREPWASVDWAKSPDWEWDMALTKDGDELREFWSAACERSRAIVARLCEADAAFLNSVFPLPSGETSVAGRWVLTHMIEEYGRHAGHADLLREAIDGTTGE